MCDYQSVMNILWLTDIDNLIVVNEIQNNN